MQNSKLGSIMALMGIAAMINKPFHSPAKPLPSLSRSAKRRMTHSPAGSKLAKAAAKGRLGLTKTP